MFQQVRIKSDHNPDIEYEAREETTTWHYGPNREYIHIARYTTYVPVGTPEYKIPEKVEPLKLDWDKIAELREWSDKVMRDLHPNS
jgi:O-phosphoseryl-tRNA(Cys) synthetase